MGHDFASGRSSAVLDESDDELKHHNAPLLHAPVTNTKRRRWALAWLKSRPRIVWRTLRRQPRSVPRILVRYLSFLVLALAIVTPIFFPSYTRLPAHYTELRQRCGPEPKDGCANPHNEKVFIAVSLYDRKGKLAGGVWGEEVLELVRLIGPDNAFLSIYENDSGATGERALEAFKKRVPCKHSIVSEAHVPYSLFPHITMPDGTQRLKRLAYLSEMRNRALYPLDLLGGADGAPQEYDRILFLNDAVFSPLDAAHLLFSTNTGPDGRAHYLTACALDYDTPGLLYDLYAQRDAEGYSNGLPIFPYFARAGAGASRAAVLAQSDAVPVRSCWGGMVAVQARWVQHRAAAAPSPDWRSIARHVVDPDHPRPAAQPVRFRYEPELFFDACECCLFLADVAAVAAAEASSADNPADLAVVVNPYVRVAYGAGTLGWERWVRRWERLFALPQRWLTPLLRLPTHNPHRAVREGEAFEEEIYARPEGWRAVQRTGRAGMFCGVREMQLVVEKPRGGGKNYEDYTDMHLDEQKLYFPM